MSSRPFGVIEGFYGDPWTQQERLGCIDALAGMGANAYVWAPKSEPRHRDAWRDHFTAGELSDFAALIARSDKVTVSIGLAETSGNPDPDKLFRRADRALYRSKSSGRNRVTAAAA